MLGFTFRDRDAPRDDEAGRIYPLLDAYAADGHIPPLEPEILTGHAHAIVLTYDVLREQGACSWDACDATTARAAGEEHGSHHAEIARAVLAFRRWLRATGRAGDRGIASLERLVRELEGSEQHANPPPNRAERRWQARVDRRARRR